MDDDIEDLINNNELIEINTFAEIEEISFGESIFMFTDIEYKINNEDEWDRRREK